MTDMLIGGQVDTASLEALDFTPALPCEHSEHESKHGGGPGRYFYKFQCPACPNVARVLICEAGWAYMRACTGIQCSACNESTPFEECVTLLEDLKA